MADGDWQTGKSLVECNREMLTKEIGCDVTFEVGPPGCLAKSLHAHKYMLVCRCKVFADLFQEDYTVSETRASIRVKDVEASAFQEMLSYIYTDEAVITPDLALPLISAANKYNLPGLVDKCNIYLRDNLVTEHVCTILDQSLSFSDLELKERCINHICVNADSIVKTKAFLDLSPTALEIVIERDNFNLASNDECDIHEVCVKWARSQLERNSEINSATYPQIRDHLGKAFWKIRYPVLSKEIFALKFGTMDILTGSEQNDIYFYAITKTKRDSLAFNCEPRKVDCFVERYTAVGAGPCSKEETFDAIRFTTDKTISLSAVGLYGGYNTSDYVTTINVQENDDIISRTTTLVHKDGTSNLIKVALYRPITLRAGVAYTVWTPPAPQMYAACGVQGQQDYTVSGVKFTFSASTNPISLTTVITGQLPRFYFSCDPEPIQEFTIQRYLAVTSEPWDSTASNGDAIQFTCCKDIYLLAVGLYAGLAGVEYDVKVKIQKQIGAQVINETSAHVVSGPAVQTVKIPLSQPVPIYAGVAYVIWTPASNQQYGFYGNTGQITTEAGDVTFTFNGCTDPAGLTTLEQGQIPQLYYERRYDVIAIPENAVERYGDSIAGCWDSTALNDSISFTCSTSVLLTAVGLFSVQGAVDYDITVNIQLNNVIVNTTVAKVRGDGRSNKIRVPLAQPFMLKAGVLITLWTPPVAQTYGYYGLAGRRTSVVNGVTFTFFNSMQPASNTTISNGQLPEIYFKDLC